MMSMCSRFFDSHNDTKGDLSYNVIVYISSLEIPLKEYSTFRYRAKFKIKRGKQSLFQTMHLNVSFIFNASLYICKTDTVAINLSYPYVSLAQCISEKKKTRREDIKKKT